MGTAALKDALDKAHLDADELDGVILACSNFSRVYPAIAIEVQHAIGMTRGFGYDMNVACSAATFGIAQAAANITANLAKRIAVVNVEVPSAHLNFKNRDSHFIFGDVAAAVIVSATPMPECYALIDSRMITQFSANIKNEYGFLDRAEALACGTPMHADIENPITNKLFSQEGRRVFKEVCPMVSQLISSHLADNGIDKSAIKKMWLHQANVNMIDLILRSVMGKDADKSIAPIAIENYGNTSSASPIVAYALHQDLNAGDMAVMCSFGAGYSAGSLILRKC